MLEYLSRWCLRGRQARRSYNIHQCAQTGCLTVFLTQLGPEGTWRRTTLQFPGDEIHSPGMLRSLREAARKLRASL